ncbi:MAG: DUF4870 family protein [Alphaproteobacteria bacterium]
MEGIVNRLSPAAHDWLTKMYIGGAVVAVLSLLHMSVLALIGVFVLMALLAVDGPDGASCSVSRAHRKHLRFSFFLPMLLLTALYGIFVYEVITTVENDISDIWKVVLAHGFAHTAIVLFSAAWIIWRLISGWSKLNAQAPQPAMGSTDFSESIVSQQGIDVSAADASDPAAEPALGQDGSKDQMPIIVYGLFLVSFLLLITGWVSIIIAHLKVGAAPPLQKSHYQFFIRTFWFGFLGAFIAAFLHIALIGPLALLGVAGWMLVRCIRGILLYNEGKPIEDPQTWTW